MNRARVLAVVVTAVVAAGACSSGGDDEQVTVDPTPTASGDDRTASPDRGDDERPDDEQPDAEPEELFSPTETDAPFELDGGAVSSSEGVTVNEDNRSLLQPVVVQATGSWDTDWTRATIDPSTLLLGIGRADPRDVVGGGVIDVPKFESVSAAGQWLDPREPGALVRLDGEARFYPLSILTRHEVVNDRFGDVPVAVTYCPLCNTAVSFDRRVDGEVLRFGTSGLLRNSDLVMWDRETQTLWQQVTGEGIVGELAGTRLEPVPTAIVSFGQFAADHPDAVSLSRETGVGSDYGANPYVGYSLRSVPITAFVDPDDIDPRFAPLSRVVGVTIDGEESRAYPFEVIAEESVVNDEVGGVPVVVFWGGDTADALSGATVAFGDTIGTGIAFDRRIGSSTLSFTTNGDDTFTDDQTGTVWSLTGLGLSGELAGERLEPVTHRNEFWFVWSAFFPDAAVYEGA